MSVFEATYGLHPNRTSAGRVRPPSHAYIIDRNPVLAQCVSASLSDMPALSCEAARFDPEALPFEVLDKAGSHVVIFDPAHLTVSLTEFVASAANAKEVMHFVAYSFDTSNEGVNAALDAGIDCFTSKEESLSVLYLAIATAAHGGRFLCPTTTPHFHRVHHGAARDIKANTQDPKSCLSSRELAVLTALARGLSQKQTAFELRLSDKTVSTYKSRAMKKLGLMDRAAIVEFAMAQNLIPHAPLL